MIDNQLDKTVRAFSYEEAYNKSLEYFKGNEIAAEVFVNKYAMRDNDGNLLECSPKDEHIREAKEFARIEEKKFKNPLSFDEIFNLLDDYKYIVVQGSPAFGIGNKYQVVSLSNCYLIEKPTDSYGGILRADQQLVQISKRRGGVGVDLSELRPTNAITHNAARTSTGIVSWMQRYSNSITEVGQNARRGALMITISIHHPDSVYIDESQWDNPQQVIIRGDKSKGENDILTDSRFYDEDHLDFASVKLNRRKVTGANISIRLSDEFLNAVKNGERYEQRFPIDYKERGIKPLISKMVDARKVWQKIIHLSWQSAEPGLLFWDRIIKYNPIDGYADDGFKTSGVNPCQPSFATVLTPNGIKEFGQTNIGDKIWSQDGWVNITNKQCTGTKSVYKYITSFGEFIGTENHRIVSNGIKAEAKDSDSIDLLRGPSVDQPQINVQDVMDGLVIGDGSVHKSSNNLVVLYIGRKDYDYFDSEISSLIKENRTDTDELAYTINTTVSKEELPCTDNRFIPNRFRFGDANKKIGFLRGLFSANGCVVDKRICLKASSIKIVKQLQEMLNSIGIASYITRNKEKTIEFKNGEYNIKQSYDINITRDRDKFAVLIGFIQKYKQEKLQNILDNIQPSDKPEIIAKDIISTEYIGEHEVYDITVDGESHTYWTGGLNVSNCSEISLSELDSCRLMFQNLYSYVVNPFTDKAQFDYNLFFKHAKIAQRLMDDLVDLEIEKIDIIINKIKNDPESEDVKFEELRMWQKVKKACLDARRTGLGISGIADAFAALGIKYGSDDSIKIAARIFETQKMASYESSVDMAKEIGAFPIWNWDKEKNSEFLLKIKETNPNLYNSIAKYGRRNAANLTCAPVGSRSLLTGTSSGIEPLFRIEPYIRRKKINPTDNNVCVDFVDGDGNKWKEFVINHPKLIEWMNITGEKDFKKSPWYGCCANDIDWKKRVELQAACQMHIDHAISSTINLPQNVSEEKVAEIFNAAWELGCKGITVYRDGCRTGVLINKKDLKQKDDSYSKRPKTLPCDIHHIKVSKKLDKPRTFDYCVVVGLRDNMPYEIFAFENGKLDKRIAKGEIVKIKRGQYNIVAKDQEGKELVIDDITKSTTEEEDALTRMTSVALRHNVEIGFILDQLEKTQGDMMCFSKALARALKKYIKDGTKVTGQACPNCGNNSLIREEGCAKCSCGWSKC